MQTPYYSAIVYERNRERTKGHRRRTFEGAVEYAREHVCDPGVDCINVVLFDKAEHYPPRMVALAQFVCPGNPPAGQDLDENPQPRNATQNQPTQRDLARNASNVANQQERLSKLLSPCLWAVQVIPGSLTPTNPFAQGGAQVNILFYPELPRGTDPTVDEHYFQPVPFNRVIELYPGVSYIRQFQLNNYIAFYCLPYVPLPLLPYNIPAGNITQTPGPQPTPEQICAEFRTALSDTSTAINALHVVGPPVAIAPEYDEFVNSMNAVVSVLSALQGIACGDPNALNIVQGLLAVAQNIYTESRTLAIVGWITSGLSLIQSAYTFLTTHLAA